MDLNNLYIEYFIKNNGFIYFKNIKNNKIYKLNVCEDTNNIVLKVNDDKLSNYTPSSDTNSRYSNFVDIEKNAFIFKNIGKNETKIIKIINNDTDSESEKQSANYYLNIYNEKNELILKNSTTKDILKYNVFILSNGKIKLTYYNEKKKYLLKRYNNNIFLNRYF
tara:strand:+ start:30 stop:524 length:495 start_codon:yes stop_codon:yes gene_type:complete